MRIFWLNFEAVSFVFGNFVMQFSRVGFILSLVIFNAVTEIALSSRTVVLFVLVAVGK